VSPKNPKTGPSVMERLSSMLEEQYTLTKEIGRGGMSVVYLAKDLRHDRLVAVKLVQPEITTASSAERFLREIQITAKLQHPHILPLLDSGANEGLLYYIMPHIDGESLRDRLSADDRLSFEEAVGITQQIAAALQYAHDNGIIHRDVKPENILLSAGLAVLSDFGVASAIGDDENDSTTRFTVGTPAYMAPEQAEREKVDHRADQYSLACVLFEMLTGAPPFFAGTVGETIQGGSRSRCPACRRPARTCRRSWMTSSSARWRGSPGTGTSRSKSFPRRWKDCPRQPNRRRHARHPRSAGRKALRVSSSRPHRLPRGTWGADCSSWAAFSPSS
jgi:serine/threonine protein kinase